EVELELSALGRQIARAVRGDAPAEARFEMFETRSRRLRHELGAAAAARKRERGMPGANEAREQLGRFVVGRGARAGMLVEQPTLPAGEHPLRTRGAVVVDLFHRKSAQLARERSRVADRRAREAEGGVRAVVLAHP